MGNRVRVEARALQEVADFILDLVVPLLKVVDCLLVSILL